MERREELVMAARRQADSSRATGDDPAQKTVRRRPASPPCVSVSVACLLALRVSKVYCMRGFS